MASSPENRQFEEDARKMVDDLAREDPDKLQELYKASQELQSIMKDNPEMFKSTFQDYIKKLEQGVGIHGGGGAWRLCVCGAACVCSVCWACLHLFCSGVFSELCISLVRTHDAWGVCGATMTTATPTATLSPPLPSSHQAL